MPIASVSDASRIRRNSSTWRYFPCRLGFIRPWWSLRPSARIQVSGPCGMIQPTSGGWKKSVPSSFDATVTIPAVPTTAMQSPGRATPTPSDDAVMSIWPLKTGVPSRRPVTRAAWPVTVPHCSVGLRSLGSTPRVCSLMPNASKTLSE